MITKQRPTFDEEELLWQKGFEIVSGLDEVGRGAFAGPVVTACVVFDKDKKCPPSLASEINDSKLLSKKTRERLDIQIRHYAKFYKISSTPVSLINKQGIGKAAFVSFRKSARAVYDAFMGSSIFLLIDGFEIQNLKTIQKSHQKAIIKGDQKSVSIAAASILAKVYRDKLMDMYHRKYPQYDFSLNKGYGTAAHRAMLKAHGICPLHRTSFNLLRHTL